MSKNNGYRYEQKPPAVQEPPAVAPTSAGGPVAVRLFQTGFSSGYEKTLENFINGQCPDGFEFTHCMFSFANEVLIYYRRKIN